MTDAKSGIGYPGSSGLKDDGSEFNRDWFVIQQALGLTRTMVVVKVVAVTSNGEVAQCGYVDVHPLVNQTDGLGKAVPHGNVLELPYIRLQGGDNAIICDPKVGDIGLAIISDRDISAVKSTKAEANPGSRRRFDLCDGVYLGGILNDTPVQYLDFNPHGITIHDRNENVVVMNEDGVRVTDKNSNTVVMSSSGISLTDKNSNTIVMGASGILINGVLFTRAGAVTAPGNVTAGTITLQNHLHGGVTTGAGSTATPTPGT